MKYKVTFSHSLEVEANDYYEAENKAYEVFKENLPTLYELKTESVQIK